MNEAGYYHHRAFSEEHIRRVRSFYVPYFHDADNVLELGCGRGEFLEILKGKGKRVHGVEMDPDMAKEATKKGIEVAVATAQDYLKAGDEPFDAIIAAHLLEHLTIEEADELLELSARRLCRGGILCLIIPNAESFPVLTEEFWNDPTHVRPYGHELLAYLVSKHGLKCLHRGTNPMDVGGYPVDIAPMNGSANAPFRHLPPPDLAGVRHHLATFRARRAQAEPSADSQAWDAMGELVSALTEELYSAHQRIYELNEQNLYLNHILGMFRGNFSRLVEILYAPNEYFLIGQKV